VLDIKEPFLKKDNIAWFASHYHFGYPTANVPYEYSYIFKYEIDMDQKTDKITLPKNSKIKIFAITVAKDKGDNIQLLQPLYDDFKENKSYSLRNQIN
jgi:alpha-mannosidase